MWKRLNEVFIYFTNLGVKSEQKLGLVKSIKMMNQLSLVCALFGIIFSLQVMHLKPGYLRIMEIVAILSFVLVPFINRAGWYGVAKYFHYLVLNAYCFVTVLSLGFKSGYELLYIPIIAATSLVANFRKVSYVIHSLGVPFVSILLLLFFNDSMAINPGVYQEELEVLYRQNFMFTVILSFLVAFFYYKITDQQNGMLRELLHKEGQLIENLQLNEKKLHSNLQYSDALLERLKASKDYFKSLLQNASDITFVVDESGGFKYLTPSFYRMTGFKPGDVFGKTMYDFIHEDDLAEAAERFNLRKEDTPKPGLFKFRCKTQQGNYLVLEAIGTNLLNDENVKGFVINSRDITDRLRFEQEVILKEKNIRSILDNNNNFIYLIDRDFKLLDFNIMYSRAISGTFGIELERNMSILDLARDGDYDKWLMRYQTALKGEEKTYIDLYQHKGFESTYKVSVFPIFGAEGGVERITVFLQDITEQVNIEKDLVQAKEAAEEATKAKGLFLSTMSHEIRTPMNAVIGMTHLLLQEDPKPEQVENLRILKFSAENLLVLINDILDFSKIEAGKVQLEETPFDPGRHIINIKDALLPAAREKEVQLDVLLDEDLPGLVVGDPVRLSQIMTNLIGNGIKFTEKGSVQVKLSLAGSSKEQFEIDFEVKDTGIGIPANMQGEIFESFTQGSSDTTRRFGGTGLGLAITRRLLELMGSKIKLQSMEGTGSSFSFRLNFKREDKTSVIMHTPSNKEDCAAILKGCRILMVEDNPLNTFVGTKFLQKWGVELDIAENGLLALGMVIENNYDLILMDLQMPVMDGYEATIQIRQMQDRQKAAIPILAISAAAEQHIHNKAMEAGMNDFVNKPFIPDELRQKLGRYLLHKRTINL